jgi:hypothetical protein
MDIDSLVAIDVHTHVHRSVNAPKAKPEDNEHGSVLQDSGGLIHRR